MYRKSRAQCVGSAIQGWKLPEEFFSKNIEYLSLVVYTIIPNYNESATQLQLNLLLCKAA